ncbi:PqqA binding protein [Alteromonas sp. 38]|uniref:pyrroloquinoline quinone biosynthesis peptide chaperone PqqD n=1 Tax=Alteromonas TaxID=226 RepID=UPI0012F3B1F3|nr:MULTISPECIES: pyrroloquinoline quinone biosynthesis peptide chaperone PqqD [Alteromonas]CAD5260630.1 PqqA binding protein [Alteromonas sp. 154]VXC31448.1 PqqA binding protein [Alteromonas sp. 38]
MTNKSNTPSMNPLFRLQYEKVQDGYVLLFPEGMIKLNPSASEILTLVDGVRSTEDIAVALRKAFPDAPEDLEEDVTVFLQHAEEKKWVVYD